MRDSGAKVSRIADDLQATVMSIRMMPVRQVFQALTASPPSRTVQGQQIAPVRGTVFPLG